MERLSIILMILGRSSRHHDSVRMMSQNINTFGLRFTSHEQLDVGEEVQLEILLCSGSSPLKIASKVIWKRECRVGGRIMWEGGVEFLDVPAEMLSRLRRFICRYRLPR